MISPKYPHKAFIYKRSHRSITSIISWITSPGASVLFVLGKEVIVSIILGWFFLFFPKFLMPVEVCIAMIYIFGLPFLDLMFDLFITKITSSHSPVKKCWGFLLPVLSTNFYACWSLHCIDVTFWSFLSGHDAWFIYNKDIFFIFSSQDMLRSSFNVELDASNATWLTNDVAMLSTKTGELLSLTLVYDGRWLYFSLFLFMFLF